MRMSYTEFNNSLFGKDETDVKAVLISDNVQKDIIISHLVTKPVFVSYKKNNNFVCLVVPSIEIIEHNHSIISKYVRKYTPYFTIKRKSDGLILLTVRKRDKLIISEKMSKEIKEINRLKTKDGYTDKLNRFINKYGFNPFDYHLKIIKGWENKENEYARR